MDEKAASMAEEASGADHLCVLIHGLWGNPRHLDYLTSQLHDRFAASQLRILAVHRNAGSFTYDGIELGGERVTHEIEDTLHALERAGTPVRRLSVIGYSLGGLVARYAVGILAHKGWFDEGRLEPVNFTTFATPHLGVRSPLLGYHNHIWNVLGARTLSTSGRQMFLIDGSFRDTGRPLLAVMADPEGVFMRALARFQRRSLYANVINDRSAVYYTTGIARTDPFTDMERVALRYVDGYDDVIVDGRDPIAAVDGHPLRRRPSSSASASLAHPQPPSALTTIPRTSRSLFRTGTFKSLPTYALIALIVPLATVVFLCNSAYQSARSRARIRAHHAGRAAFAPGLYSVPLSLDDAYTTAGAAQPDQHLPSSASSSTDADDTERGEAFAAARAKARAKDHDDHFPTLALHPAQFMMIDELDELGWEKHLVHIKKNRHAHAAIIRRMDKPSFDEGRVVVRHWLERFEI